MSKTRKGIIMKKTTNEYSSSHSVFKRIFLSVLTIAMVMMNLSLMRIDAATANVEEEFYSNGWHATFSSGIPAYFKVNGNVAWCVEPGLIADVGSNQVVSWDKVFMYDRKTPVSQDVRDKIAMIAYFGYWADVNHTGNAQDNYVLTQNLIWKILGRPTDQIYVHDSKYPNLQSQLVWQNTVMQYVDSMFTYPSFNANTVSLNQGESITLTDSNKVLQYYRVADAGGLSATISGNNLILTANSNNVKNAAIYLVRNDISENRIGADLVVKNDGSQAVSTLMVTDPPRARINVNVTTFGELKIAKMDNEGNYVPDTSFNLSSNSDMSQIIGTYTTGSDGTVTIPNLLPKTYYIQEVKVPSGLAIDSTIHSIKVESDKTATFTKVNQIGKGSVYAKKEDAETGGNSQGQATFENAVYALAVKEDIIHPVTKRVILSAGTVIAEHKADKSGNIPAWTNLYPGVYEIYEVKQPNGYNLDNTRYEVIIDSGNQASVTVSKTLKDTVIKGSVKVWKKDAESQNPITVTHAEIELLNWNREVIDTKETNDEGFVVFENLPYGQYYVREKNAPESYLLNPDQLLEFFIDINGEIEEGTLLNKRVYGSIRLTKEFLPTESGMTGEAHLEGVSYALFAHSDILDSADGSIIFEKGTMIPDSLKKTDADGQITWDHLYLGSYDIHEIESNGTVVINTVDVEADLEYIDQDTPAISVSVTHKDKPNEQAYSLIKISSDGSTGETETLEGIEFTAKLKSDVEKMGWDQAPVYDISVTDSKGYLVSKRLPYGTYIIKETKSADEHEPIEDFEIVITEDSSEPQVWRVFNDAPFKALVRAVKVDKETGKTVLLPDTAFKIKNLDTNEYVGQWVWFPFPHFVDTFKTDESGTVTTPDTLEAGTYELEEIHAPYGYIVDSTPIQFKVSMNTAYQIAEDGQTPLITVTKKDESVKGKIKVSKVGEQLVDVETDDHGNIQFVYDELPVDDAEFIVEAGEDIYSADNQKTLIYSEGEQVAKLTTKNGYAETGLLPLGKYRVYEITAGEPFVLDPEIKEVELTYKDENTPLVFDKVEAVNQRQRIDLNVKKTDQETDTGLSGALFGLYASEDVRGVKSQEILVNEGTLIETVTTDENGKAKFNADLPIGFSFEIREIKAPVGYSSTDEVYSFVTNYQGQEIPVLELNAVFRNQIIQVEVSKMDITNEEEIAGAFLIAYPKGDEGAIFDSWISGQDGVNEDGTIRPHVIRGLEVGKTYVLKEISAPHGYAIAQEVEFTVQDTGKIQKVEMKDDMVFGQLKWNKYGEIFDQVITGQNEFGVTQSPVWNESNLLGAEITIYAAEEIRIGNHVYYEKDEEIQTLESDWGDVLSQKLPVGKYYYKESKTPHGYITDTNKHYFEVADNQISEIQIIDSALENERPTFEISMTKVLEEQKIFQNKDAYKDIVFGIFAREDIYDYMGNVAIENGTMISTSGITEDGHLANVPDLPNGVYYLKELAANEQYVLDDTEYDFEIGYKGGDVSHYIVTIGKDGIIENELARGTVHVKKKDSFDDEKVLSGVPFSISSKEDMSEIIETVETDDNGIATFHNLELGVYYIQEAQQIDGYVSNDHIYQVEVSADGDELTIICENQPTEMLFSKQDSATNKELPDAWLILTDKKTGAVIDEWISSYTPHKVSYLVEGKEYIMTEKSAPEGYEIAESIEFVAKDGLTIVMQDSRIPSTPETGDGSNIVHWLGIFTFAMFAVMGLIVFRKNKS